MSLALLFAESGDDNSDISEGDAIETDAKDEERATLAGVPVYVLAAVLAGLYELPPDALLSKQTG